MKRRSTHWFPVVLLALLAGLTYWLERSVQATLPKKDGSQRHDPDYYVENFTAVRLGADGRPESRLKAAKMTHYPDDDSTQLISPLLYRYGKDKPVTSIRSKTGLVSREGEHVYFIDDVKAVRAAYGDRSEMVVTTSWLHAEPDKGTADTDRPVVIRDAKTRITGVGLHVDDNTRILQLHSRVRARYDKTPNS